MLWDEHSERFCPLKVLTIRDYATNMKTSTFTIVILTMGLIGLWTSAGSADQCFSATPGFECGSAGTDFNACDGTPACRWCRCGKLADPWTLPQPKFLADRNVTIGGWLEGGIYGNQYGSADNGPIGLRNIGNGATADQLWIFAEKKTDTKGCGWDIGGRIDYLFGTDGPYTQAFGDRTWDYGWNTPRFTVRPFRKSTAKSPTTTGR